MKKEKRRNYLVGFAGRDPQVYCFGEIYTELMTKKEAIAAIPHLTNSGRADVRRVFKLVPVPRRAERRRKVAKEYLTTPHPCGILDGC